MENYHGASGSSIKGTGGKRGRRTDKKLWTENQGGVPIQRFEAYNEEEEAEWIARQVEGPVIAGLARTHFADIESAANAVADAERPRIHTFISTSDIHITHQLQSTREDVLGQARAAVAHAREFVEDVEFSPMDATRSELEFTAEVVAAAGWGG